MDTCGKLIRGTDALRVTKLRSQTGPVQERGTFQLVEQKMTGSGSIPIWSCFRDYDCIQSYEFIRSYKNDAVQVSRFSFSMRLCYSFRRNESWYSHLQSMYLRLQSCHHDLGPINLDEWRPLATTPYQHVFKYSRKKVSLLLFWYFDIFVTQVHDNLLPKGI